MKYIISRIMKMDYKEFFNKVSEISKENNKNKIIVFFDIIYCALKYGAGYVDYYSFEMYKLNKKERKTFITRGKNNLIVKSLNNVEKSRYFNSKILFNQHFSDYLNREWIYLDNNFDDFKDFIKNKKEIICKPVSLMAGEGIEKLKVKDFKPKTLYKKLVNNKQLLIEEVAIQHKNMNKIHPSSINTIRIITINTGKNVKIFKAILRIGNNNSVVDNVSAGGMATYVNIETGKVEYPAIDKYKNIYEKHPITKESIVGFNIPHWEEAKKICIKAAKVIEGVNYVGWDVCIGEKFPYIIEGNEFPGHRILQLPLRENQKEGLLPLYEKLKKEK